MLKIFKLSGIYLTFSLISSIVGFLVLPIISNYIDVKNFGILATYIVMMSGLLPALIGFSLHSIITRSYNIRDDVNSMIFSSYVFSFIMTVLVSILLYLISENIKLNDTWSFNNLIILIWISYISFIAIFNLTLIQLEGKALIWGITSFLSLVVGVSFTFILLFNTELDFLARIYGIGLNSFTSVIITVYYLKNKIDVNLILFKNHSKYFFKLGIPLLITAIFSWFLINQGRFFIEYYLDLEQLGIYSMAFTLASPLLVVSVAIGRAWLSMGYKFLKDKEYNKYMLNASYLILILFILGLLNSFIGKYIYSFMIDEKYYESFVYIPYFSIVFFIMGVEKFILPVLLHFEKVKLFTYLNVIGAILSAIILFYFVDSYGLYVVVFTSIFIHFMITFCVFYYIKREGFLDD